MPFLRRGGLAVPCLAQWPVTIRTKRLAKRIAAARKWQVPPALVVARCRTGPVVKARLEAMQAMFALGLKRCQIAAAFGRDLRRVRSSVIGGPPRNPNRLNLVF